MHFWESFSGKNLLQSEVFFLVERGINMNPLVENHAVKQDVRDNTNVAISSLVPISQKNACKSLVTKN